MALAITQPTKHPKTGGYRVRKAVPKDLRAVVGKREPVRSLGTKDAAEARRLAARLVRTMLAFGRDMLGRAPVVSLVVV